MAPTKFVAKLASARCKPDGLLVVPAARVLDFLHPLPVTALWGVGARTAEPLHRLGIRTVGDLAATPFDTLRRAVGSAAAEHLSALAARASIRARCRPGRGREVDQRRPHRSTIDLTDEADVRRELLRLAEEVGSRVRARGFVARTVGIKIRFADFRTVTRVRTLPAWTDSTPRSTRPRSTSTAACDLDRPRIRLVGVKCEGLREAGEVAEQLTLDLDASGATTRRPRRPDPGDRGRASSIRRPTRSDPAALLGAGSGARALSRRPGTDISDR